MKQRAVFITVWALIGFLAASSASAQVVMRHGGGDGEPSDIVLMHELGIVVGPAEDSDDLSILMLLPGKEREIDLEQGDLVLMINGKRVRELADLREAYEGAAMGEVVKLGFRRGDERFLSSFERAEDDMAGGRRVMVAGGPGGEFSDMQPLTEFSVVLGQKDDKIVVSMMLPMDKAGLEQGDEIKSINGTSIDSVAELRDIYEALAIGDEVAIVAVRDGKEISSTRPKSEPRGVRIRSSH